jgi:hypothetical protein
MSTLMEVDIKHWMTKGKAALVMEIIQFKKTVTEASRSFDLPQMKLATTAMESCDLCNSIELRKSTRAVFWKIVSARIQM